MWKPLLNHNSIINGVKLRDTYGTEYEVTYSGDYFLLLSLVNNEENSFTSAQMDNLIKSGMEIWEEEKTTEERIEELLDAAEASKVKLLNQLKNAPKEEFDVIIGNTDINTLKYIHDLALDVEQYEINQKIKDFLDENSEM